MTTEATQAIDESSPAASPWMRVLDADERRTLHQTNALRSWLSFAVNWVIIAAAFALVGWAPNPLTVVLAIFVIGARQLGCAILMHEAAHRSLFRSRELNDWAGNWLAAYPVWLDVAPYRSYHLKHHKHTWTDLDPDLALAMPFPITPRSFGRKVWRDLSGQTGWKRAVATYKRDLGKSRGKVKRDGSGWSAFRGVVLTNALLLGALALTGHAELYLLWVVAWFTTFSLVLRIRSIAEHAMIDDPADPLGNTRTTIASWWERLLLAPNRVNYHLEHHLMMAVPHYNLPRMHEMLRARGAFSAACIAHGYLEVRRRATTGAAGASGAGTHGAPAGDQSLTFG